MGNKKDMIKAESGSAENLDDDNIIYVMEGNSTEKKLPKKFNYIIDVCSTMPNENIRVKFKLPVSIQKSIKSSITKNNLGKTTLGDKCSIRINQLDATPVYTSVQYSCDKEPNDEEEHIFFSIKDDKGRIYGWCGSSGNGDEGSIYRSSPIDKDVKKLYITPYLFIQSKADYSEEKFKAYDFYGKAYDLDVKREFDLSNLGKMNVYKTEKSNNSIKIYYTFEGMNYILGGNNPISIFEKTEGFLVSNENTKTYQTDSNRPNYFCNEFTNINPNKEYTYSLNCGILGAKTIAGKTIEVNIK